VARQTAASSTSLSTRSRDVSRIALRTPLAGLITQRPSRIAQLWSARREDAALRDAERWFATGDVGSIDADGYLRVTDRRKDLIKCAGEWISSVAIEILAMEHPAVMQAAAIGVPDEK
jgi:3-(methylthio)propionyl---CoA ligase